MQFLINAILTIAALVGAQDRGKSTPPAEQLRVLKQEMEAVEKDDDNARKHAKVDADREKIDGQYLERANAIADRAMELARKHPNDPAAFDTLMFVIDDVRCGAGQALRALAHDFVGSDRLVEAIRAASLGLVEESDAVETMLRAALEKSPHHKVRGFACYYLARHLKLRAGFLSEFAAHPEEVERFKNTYRFNDEVFTRYRARDAAELAKESAALYEKTIAQFHDLSTLRTASLGQLADGELFDLRRLAVGKEAPEIAGRDVDGRQIKLSDYRGKVVVLTFSGNWCGGCVALYPHQRRLVEQLRDEPFALLSVTNDAEQETVRKAIEAGEITWRCFWDEGRDGPISVRWGIYQWPTIFVLDPKGVIRARGVRGEELVKVVDSLLKEQKTSTGSGG